MLGKLDATWQSKELHLFMTSSTTFSDFSIAEADDDDLVSPPWPSNLYYIQADDTFDDSLVNEPPLGCNSNTNSAAYAGKRCVPPLRCASFYGDTAGCFMNVDESSSVEPLSCREKCLPQPALGCDKLALERFIDDCNCNCTCNNDSLMRKKETKNSHDQRWCRQPLGDNYDVDDEKEEEEEKDDYKKDQTESSCYDSDLPVFVAFIFCGVLESCAEEDSL